MRFPVSSSSLSAKVVEEKLEDSFEWEVTATSLHTHATRKQSSNVTSTSRASPNALSDTRHTLSSKGANLTHLVDSEYTDVCWESDDEEQIDKDDASLEEPVDCDETDKLADSQQVVSSSTNHDAQVPPIASNVMSHDAYDRILSTASQLADYATRIVQRELKAVRPTVTNASTTIKHTAPSTDHVDDSDALMQLMPPPPTVAGSEMQPSSSRLVPLQPKASGNDDQSFDEMRLDIIEMLNAFSLPYVVAPFEAEAQCAALEQVKLLESIVS
jgi:ABC-type transporter Mla subunit MlaD